MISRSVVPLHLGVMAKYWQSGRVKTRLGKTIGMQESARLHREFCRVLAGGLGGSGDRRSFVVTPSAKRSEFESLVGPAWQIENQCDGDLGRRMQGWFEQPGRQNRILIGADCPTLDDAVIDAAAEQLTAHDVVLGPARDGGYYLIGLRGPWRREYGVLFDQIPWSSETVFSDSCRQAESVGLRVGVIDVREDVDSIDELQRLREALRETVENMSVGGSDPSNRDRMGQLYSVVNDVIEQWESS